MTHATRRDTTTAPDLAAIPLDDELPAHVKFVIGLGIARRAARQMASDLADHACDNPLCTSCWLKEVAGHLEWGVDSAGFNLLRGEILNRDRLAVLQREAERMVDELVANEQTGHRTGRQRPRRG